MRVPTAFAVFLLSASAASAQEAITTGPQGSGAPPSASAPTPPMERTAPDDSPAANGDWARVVLAGRPAQRASVGQARTGSCEAPPDRKPHGEVWGGVGTGGYREVGGVVTQPIGECGSVTIAVDKTEFDGDRRGRR